MRGWFPGHRLAAPAGRVERRGCRRPEGRQLPSRSSLSSPAQPCWCSHAPDACSSGPCPLQASSRSGRTCPCERQAPRMTARVGAGARTSLGQAGQAPQSTGRCSPCQRASASVSSADPAPMSRLPTSAPGSGSCRCAKSHSRNPLARGPRAQGRAAMSCTCQASRCRSRSIPAGSHRPCSRASSPSSRPLASRWRCESQSACSPASPSSQSASPRRCRKPPGTFSPRTSAPTRRIRPSPSRQTGTTPPSHQPRARATGRCRRRT
mmetsp:Transcript_41223/g.101162  ORF Transcript_41223/g.101162 Transcript_41223/m.101162 type:complete len:265 (-) Transcript_41223:2152-2946(-)